MKTHRPSSALWKWIAALASALCVIGAATTARAQNITIDTGFPVRTTSPNMLDYFTKVSQADCLSDDEYQFDFSIPSPAGLSLEVWYGDNCATQINRTGTNVTCTNLNLTNTQPPVDLPISVPDSVIAAAVPGGAIKNCVDTSGGTGYQGSLWFLLVNGEQGGDIDPSNYYQQEVDIDLTGPIPPTLDSIGVGDSLLKLDYSFDSSATDNKGYKAYCVDVNAVPASGGAGGSGGGAGGTGGAGGAGGAFLTVGAGGAGGTGGATTSTTASSGGSDAGVDAGSMGSSVGLPGGLQCSTNVLIANHQADDAYLVSGSDPVAGSEVIASGLINGHTYACGVAAVDLLNNTGALSALGCGQPVAIEDFFSAYRDAGGQAGGGFCGFATNPFAATGLGGGGMLAALAMLLRRRPRSRRSKRS